MNIVATTTDNRQPTTDNRQPTTDNRQPTTDNRQPTTDNRQPTTDNRQPTTDNRQPTTDNRQPTTDNRQPTTDNRQPTTDNRQPTTDNRQPTTDNRQPTTYNKRMTIAKLRKLIYKTIIYAGLLILPIILAVAACVAINFRTPCDTDLARSGFLVVPPQPGTKPFTIRIVTFNVWDLLPFGTMRGLRMEAIGKQLSKLKPDVIGFQEAFHEGDRSILLKGLEGAGLVHHKYFRSGLVGSGLLVVSRYPIEEAFFSRYSRWGKAHKIWHGDWWAGKGVCLVRLRLPEGKGLLDFFNTHTHGNYGNDEYDDVIQSNLRECASFINKASTDGATAVAVGDFNCASDSPQLKTLATNARLVRAMKLNTNLDHIFLKENPTHDFRTVETLPIQGIVEADGKTIGLSDHSGYLTVLHAAPKPDVKTDKPKSGGGLFDNMPALTAL